MVISILNEEKETLKVIHSIISNEILDIKYTFICKSCYFAIVALVVRQTYRTPFAKILKFLQALYLS